MGIEARELEAKALELGAYRAGTVKVPLIECEESFRDLCRENSCGSYGKYYTCPPACGKIQDLIAELRTYRTAVVYQSVYSLEDSFDVEGMAEAGKRHNQLIRSMSLFLRDTLGGGYRHLGTGGCTLCERCGLQTGEPCRHPDLITRSISTYGINVSRLAPLAGMKYINGQDTVTHFGMILLR